jgi:cell division septation protein DedD
VGQFKDGNTYGKGIMIFPDGNEYEGRLQDGTFIKDHMSKGKGATTVLGTYPYTIQVGSCQKRENSNNLTMKLRRDGLPAFVSPALIPGRGDFYRIFIGYYRTFNETRRAASQLKDQKDLHPIESKMPYAIQVGAFHSDQELIKLEAALRSKEYLAYSIPGTNDNSMTRLLVGAFKTEQEAARFSKRFQIEGIEAKVVTR